MVRKQSGTLRAEAVCDRLKISRRTFYRDVRLLRDAGVGIRYCPDTGTYDADVFASVFGDSLTIEEAGALLAAIMGARPRPRTRFYRVLDDLRNKVDNIILEQFADSYGAIRKAAENFYHQQSAPHTPSRSRIATSNPSER